MTSMSMGGGYIGRREVRQGYRIGGIPALAIRVGRVLELWGYRAARPIDGSRAEQQLRLERIARTAEAARDAARMDARLRGIR